jgi:hypothetical protein
VKDQLGADEVVDYTSTDVAEAYASPEKHFDIIIDCLVRVSCTYMYLLLQARCGTAGPIYAVCWVC